MKNKKHTSIAVQKISMIFFVLFSLVSSTAVFSATCPNTSATPDANGIFQIKERGLTRICATICPEQGGTAGPVVADEGSTRVCCCKSTGGTTSSKPGSKAMTPGEASLVGPPGTVKFDNPLGAELDLRLIAGNVIKAVLGIIGSVALVIFLYGGIQWMVAMGDDTKIKKGLDTMIWAGLGLVIIFGSYVAVQFLLRTLLGS